MFKTRKRHYFNQLDSGHGFTVSFDAPTMIQTDLGSLIRIRITLKERSLNLMCLVTFCQVKARLDALCFRFSQDLTGIPIYILTKAANFQANT